MKFAGGVTFLILGSFSNCNWACAKQSFISDVQFRPFRIVVVHVLLFGPVARKPVYHWPSLISCSTSSVVTCEGTAFLYLFIRLLWTEMRALSHIPDSHIRYLLHLSRSTGSGKSLKLELSPKPMMWKKPKWRVTKPLLLHCLPRIYEGSHIIGS